MNNAHHPIILSTRSDKKYPGILFYLAMRRYNPLFGIVAPYLTREREKAFIMGDTRFHALVTIGAKLLAKFDWQREEITSITIPK